MNGEGWDGHSFFSLHMLRLEHWNGNGRRTRIIDNNSFIVVLCVRSNSFCLLSIVYYICSGLLALPLLLLLWSCAETPSIAEFSSDILSFSISLVIFVGRIESENQTKTNKKVKKKNIQSVSVSLSLHISLLARCLPRGFRDHLLEVSSFFRYWATLLTLVGRRGTPTHRKRCPRQESRPRTIPRSFLTH